MKRTLRLGRIPFRNITAHPVRSLVLLLLALVQAACVFGGLTLTMSLRQEMILAQQRLGADILIYPSAAMSKISSKKLLMQGSPVEVWKERSMLSRIQECPGLHRLAYQLYIRDTTGEMPIWIVSFDPETDFVISPWMEERSRFRPDMGVLAGCQAAPGEEKITLFGRSWDISGRLLETDSQLDEMIFVSEDMMARLLDAATAAGVTRFRSLNPYEDYTVALAEVENRKSLTTITSWLNTYLRRATAVRSEETLTDTALGLRGQLILLSGITVGVWLILLLALGLAQSLMMKERKKEFYLWYAIGASRSMVQAMMRRESLLLHTAGAVCGVLGAAAVLGLFFGLPLRASCGLLAAGLTVLAGYLSAMLAVRGTAKALKGQMLVTM